VQALFELGFSLLMWVTLPWAFAEYIDKLLKAHISTILIKSETSELNDPHDWLYDGTHAVLYSGALFLLGALISLAQQRGAIPEIQGINPRYFWGLEH
jgi:hypothetical protein